MGLLTPTTDGWLRSDRLLTTAFMAPRLQATFDEDGNLRLALWGGGDLGRLSLQTDWQGPFVYGPNLIRAATGGIFMAQSQPALLIKKARAGRYSPAKKPAKWAKAVIKASVDAQSNLKSYRLPWGILQIETHGEDILITAGADDKECAVARQLTGPAIEQEARDYAAACDRLPQANDLLRSMVVQGVHTALASRRFLKDGSYAGLAAGMNYSFPSRTYYRDGHWTLQALLHVDPPTVARQIELLARGINDQGEAPSAIIVADPSQMEAWNDFRLSHPQEAAAHTRANDWWSDHTDSPLFFILTLGDYCATVKDVTLFQRYLPQVEAIYKRYATLAEKGGGLPQKPRHDRDWADNVFRAGDVSYIAGLWLAALNIIIRLDRGVLAQQASVSRETTLAALPRLITQHGWPMNYADQNNQIIEDNLSLDTLTLTLADAPGSDQLLAHIAKTLETRHNAAQPWGDWGVMCAWPPYTHRRDLRGKTLFPYRYHNGSDWPWLDGLYARERLRRGLDGWDYPLLRWWSWSLQQGWTSPVEYYSPRHGRGSLLQGWSSMAAAATLSYQDIILQKMKRRRRAF